MSAVGFILVLLTMIFCENSPEAKGAFEQIVTWVQVVQRYYARVCSGQRSMPTQWPPAGFRFYLNLQQQPISTSSGLEWVFFLSSWVPDQQNSHKEGTTHFATRKGVHAWDIIIWSLITPQSLIHSWAYLQKLEKQLNMEFTTNTLTDENFSSWRISFRTGQEVEWPLGRQEKGRPGVRDRFYADIGREILN